MTQTTKSDFLTFVKLERPRSKYNPNGRTTNGKCACCGATIFNIVTLSDGNEYGLDCAKKMQNVSISEREAIKAAETKKYKYCIQYTRKLYDWEQLEYADKSQIIAHGSTQWITAITPDEAVIKYNKKTNCINHALYIDTIIVRVVEK